jgi:hypothetical protein
MEMLNGDLTMQASDATSYAMVTVEAESDHEDVGTAGIALQRLSDCVTAMGDEIEITLREGGIFMKSSGKSFRTLPMDADLTRLKMPDLILRTAASDFKAAMAYVAKAGERGGTGLQTDCVALVCSEGRAWVEATNRAIVAQHSLEATPVRDGRVTIPTAWALSMADTDDEEFDVFASEDLVGVKHSDCLRICASIRTDLSIAEKIKSRMHGTCGYISVDAKELSDAMRFIKSASGELYGRATLKLGGGAMSIEASSSVHSVETSAGVSASGETPVSFNLNPDYMLRLLYPHTGNVELAFRREINFIRISGANPSWFGAIACIEAMQWS